MIRKYLFLGVSLVLCAGLNAAYATGAANPESSLVTQSLKTDHAWDGVKYLAYPSGQPEITILRVTIPAHTILPWHTHPMPNGAYVLSGTLTVENKEDGKRKILKAGDMIAETVNTVHRGVTGDQPVELIVFYAGVTGMPTTQPAKGDAK